jgi:bifunctional ADP-heptose synthase (sugar kinase/adenylyltransferase)
MFLRVDEGEENVDRIILTPENIEEIVESDIVIVSDYNKGFLDEETTVKIGKMSKFSVIDTKKRVSNGILESCVYIKFN